MNSKKLHTGLYKNQELAEWFGVKESALRNHKKIYLNKLSYFAEFHEEKGKVYIERILDPTYHPIRQQKYDTVKAEMNKAWSSNGLDSCSRVSVALEEKLNWREKDDYKESTMYKMVLKGRNELFGVPDTEVIGTLGSSKYVWCKTDKHGNLSFLTPEEQQIRKEIFDKYFTNTEDKMAIVKGMVATGEITSKEAWGVLCKMTHMDDERFRSYLREVRDKIGCTIVRGTYVTRFEHEELDVNEPILLDGLEEINEG